MSFVIRGRVRRATARAIDAAIGAATRRPAPQAIPASPRVLVIRCDHIGDAAMATAVLGPLRDALRPSALDVLAGPWAEAVFDSHPAVDDVITYATPWWCAARGASARDRARQWLALAGVIREIRRRRYDIGIDLRGDLRQIVFFLRGGGIPVRVSSDRTGGTGLLTHVWHHDAKLHEVEKNFAIATQLGAVGAPRLAIPPRAEGAAVERILAPAVHPHGYAVMALRGSEENRQWPAELAAVVVDALFDEHRLPTVSIGGALDLRFGEEVERLSKAPVHRLAGRIPLAESIDVIRNARVVIAVDSGPMHLAAASGAPLVALFGPGDPRVFGPWHEAAEVLAPNAPCGCHRSCRFAAGAGRCMREITPAMVLDAVRRLLT